MSTEDKRVENGALLLENEDEFEEFEMDGALFERLRVELDGVECVVLAVGWTASQQEVEEELWEQDWDDDVGGQDDAFSKRLKAELNGMQTS